MKRNQKIERLRELACDQRSLESAQLRITVQENIPKGEWALTQAMADKIFEARIGAINMTAREMENSIRGKQLAVWFWGAISFCGFIAAAIIALELLWGYVMRTPVGM